MRLYEYFQINNLAEAHIAILLKCKGSFILPFFPFE